MKTLFNTIYMSVNSHFKSSARSAQGLLRSICLVVVALLFGSLQVWGADVDVSFASWTVSIQTYDDTEWTDNGCTFTYASNNQKNWAYVRCGGKGSGMTSTIQYNSQVTIPVESVVLNSTSIGNGNSSSITITGVSVSAYSDAECTSLVSTKDLGTISYTSSNCPSSFTLTPSTPWAKDLYYKITISWDQTGTKNCGLNISSITFKEASGPTLYTVTFDANGGSVTPASATQASVGAAVTLPTPTRDGYNCTGWYTATSGGTKRGDAGGSYTPTASETIHAQWSAKTYTNYRTTCQACVDPDHVDISGRWDRFGGETISLTAAAYASAGTGSPIADGDIRGWQWEKLVGDTWDPLSDGTAAGVTISGATTKNLQITNCNGGNSGSYRCVVSTGATCSTASDGFQVKVYVLECYTDGTTIYNFTRIGDTQAGTCQINLAAGNHAFKFHADNDYYGNNGTINEDVSNWVCSTSQGNLTIAAGLGGTFTINMEYSTSGSSTVLGEPEISVTYPRKTIYLTPGVWNVDGAKFAIYYFRKVGETTYGYGWTDFITANDCGSSADIPQWNGVKMDVVRLNNTCESPNWNDKWTQTNDITLSSNDYVTITGWNESDYTYTTYSTPTYTINYAAGTGGSGTRESETKTCGVDFVLPKSAVFTRTGYTQTGWATEDGGAKEYELGGSYKTNAAQTFYPFWTLNSHTLTWNLDGGSISVAGTSAGTVAYGTALVAPTVTKTGYTFNAWSPAVDATMPDNDVTYTATWTPNTYSVRFNANGGDGSMSPQNFKYGVAQNLTSNSFTHATKSFGGWTTNSDGTGDFYTNGQSVSNLSSTQGAVIDLYAKWVDCDLYTVTLNVNGDTWKTVTQGSCGASIDLSSYQDVPSCDAKYTFVGWSETNSADPMFDAPAITKTSSYTPGSNVTLYAVYSYSAKIGTRIMNTNSISAYDSYIVVASAYKKVMCVPPSTTNLAAATDVVKSADGSKCYVTGNGTPLEIMFSDKSTYWMISKYNSSTGNNWYYYSQSSKNALAWYDEDDYTVWWIEGYIEKYDKFYDAEDYVASSTTSSKWSISIDGSGNATISEATNNRIWKYNSSDTKFGAYNSGSHKAVSLYRYDEGGSIYTTQPSMTVYSITKGAETNGTYTISAGVVCSGQIVDVSATPASGYAFSGWSSSNGGSFGDVSSASTTYTIGSGNTTLTASFVAVAPHAITWMVNGNIYTAGDPTSSLTAGTSFSTMTLPTAPENNTLSSACGAVANTFVGWSTTDMGFATGQSAPQLFTNAAGAGATYGVMGGEDVVFYAVFAQDGSSNYMSRCADTYSITLDKKEGTTDGTAVATEMGSTLDITLAPTYAGHSVEGYYGETGRTTKIANADGSLIANKSGYTDGSGKWINTTSPLTLYTNWTLNSHTLTWNLDGGSISVAGTAAGTVAYGTALVAPTVTKTGYTFNAWSPAVDATMPDNDVTYTATWTAKQYAITYKDKDDAVYSGDHTDGRPTGCPANHTYGSATDLPYGVKAGYRFDGWFTTSACTGDPITSIASDAEGPFTLYAKWTASHTFTFSKNGVVDGTLTLGQVEGGNVIMPNTTVDCGLWTTFEGWVIGDVAETTTEPATIYKPGDIFVAGNSDQEFKAVYSKHEGDASVYYEKVTSNSVTPAGEYVIASPDGKTILTGLNGNARGTYESVTISDNIISNKGNGAVLNVNKKGSKFNIKISGDTKYITSSDNTYFEYSVTDGASACMWELTNEGYIHSTDNTTRYIEFLKSGTQYFGTYTGNQWKSFLYRKRVAGTTYYTTAPASCEVPTKITVSYNDNKAYAGDQTISGMPSGTTLTFTSYPNFASYSVGAAPTDPTGYHFAGWNTSADGSGDAYAAGASVTTFGYKENITLYAQWERVYTVTFNDQGAITSRTQVSGGASVDVPGATTPCIKDGVTWTFAGWGTVNPLSQSLAGHIIIPSGTSTYIPTDDVTLYAVYRKELGTSDAFAIGTSGAYKISAKYSSGTKTCYASTKGSGLYNCSVNAGDASTFYLNYVKSGTYAGKYTLQNSAGEYIGWSSSTTLSFSEETPAYYTVTQSGDGWLLSMDGVTGSARYFTHETSTYAYNFKAYTEANPVYFTPAAAAYYYTTMSCDDDFSITFHANGGTITWNMPLHGEGTYQHLADGTEIDVFPTASFDGWTFLGWRTAGYDESTTAPEPSTIYGGSDGESGYHFTIHSNTDMYPIFTRFEDNEPFDKINGGDYYIYFLESGSDDGYGGEKRVYAASYDGAIRYNSSALCSAATTFTFTKLDNGNWTIYDNTTNKYLYGIENDDNLKQQKSATGAEWTLTVSSGNQFDAFHVGTSYGQLIAQGNGTSATFMNYSRDNLKSNPGLYHRVYLGSCTNRTFTTNPSTTPNIEIHGQVKVTSTAEKSIKAASVLTVSASNIATAKLTLTSNNSAFKFSLTSNGTYTASVNIPVESNKVGVTPIYVEYTPTIAADGIEEATITVSDGAPTPTTATTESGDVQGRHLPANFVIAAKWGDNWYALPANCTTSTSSTAGIPIVVDNDNDPTSATALSTTKYGLQTVRQSRKPDYGSRLVFTEQLSTATAEDQKTLYNGSKTSIQANAMYKNYMDVAAEKYEWIPTTTDLKDYILTSAATLTGDDAEDGEKPRTISINNSGVFGTLMQDKSYDGKVRLLPATWVDPAEVQIVEWKTNSVVVMYTGTATSATTKVGTNSVSSTQALSTHKLTHGIYELTTDQNLTNNEGKQLEFTMSDGSLKRVVIPLIISGDVTASKDVANDVIILKNAKLTAASTKYSYRNVYVYGGGKLKIASGTSLGVNNIILRAGGIATSGIGSSPSATYEYIYPQVELGGTFTSTKTNIKYEYITDYDHWYQLCLPFNATLSSITYPQEYYGNNVEAGNKGSWIIKRYAGEVRATGNYNAWKDIENDSPAKTEVTAGHGYIFWGAPKKVSVGGAAKQRQQWGIQRITMPITSAAAATTAETNDKDISVDSYSNVEGKSSKPNDQGWNLVGNPYMVNLTDLSSTSMIAGELVKDIVEGKWTGKWKNNGNGVRYVTIPDYHFDNYVAKTASVAAGAGDFMPGRAFFVQIAAGATTLTFAAENRASLMPALFARTEQSTDVETGIVLSDESKHDEVNFWIKDGKTAEYEYNADYPKTMNTTNFNIYGVHSNGELSWVAISPEIAEGSMAIGYQVPAAGDYMLSLSETYVSDEIEHVFVTDHGVSPEVTTDLMEEDYNFYVNQAETNDVRFTVAFKLKEEDPGTVTSVENATSVDSDKPLKFIYNDKMYILRNGIIYDAVGKRVSEINK